LFYLSYEKKSKHFKHSLELESLIWTWTETEKTIYYYHKDHQWSVIWLSNLSGDIILDYHYGPYGQPYVGTGGFLSFDDYTGELYGNERLYTGREYDTYTGLYYYRARYYDSEKGVFISRGPIGYADNVNLYGYVGSNPLNYTDPSWNIPVLVANLLAWWVNVGIWWGMSLRFDYDYCWTDAGLDFAFWASWAWIVDKAVDGKKIHTARKAYSATIIAESTVGVWTDYAMYKINGDTENSFNWKYSVGSNLVGSAISPAVWQFFKWIKGKTDIVFDSKKYPATSKHIKEAQKNWYPSILTIERKWAPNRRRQSLKWIKTKKWLDRDEYPPAVFLEWWKWSSVKHIDFSDNRGSWGYLGNKIKKLKDWDKVRIKIK